MNKLSKILLISSLVGIIILTFVLTKKPRNKSSNQYDYVSGSSNVSNSPSSTINKNKILKLGTRGPEVKILQEKLNQKEVWYVNPSTGLSTKKKLKIDGIFGDKTASKLFFSKNKISITLNELG